MKTKENEKKQNKKESYAVNEDKMSFELRADERVGSSIIVLTGSITSGQI